MGSPRLHEAKTTEDTLGRPKQTTNDNGGGGREPADIKYNRTRVDGTS